MDLNQLKNKECYNVPDHYFEELPKIVFQNIARQKKVLAIRRSLIAISSIAASVLLIIGIIQLRPTTHIPMTVQVTDSIAKQNIQEEIITAAANLEPTTDIAQSQPTCPHHPDAPAHIKSQPCPIHPNINDPAQLDDIAYQIISIYQEELSQNDYLNASIE